MKPYNGFLLLLCLTLCGAESHYKAGIALRSLGDVVITGDYAPLAVICSIQELEALARRCDHAFQFVRGKLLGIPPSFSQQEAGVELLISRMNNKLNKLTRMLREDGLDKAELRLLYGGSLEKAQLMNKRVEEELPKSNVNRNLPILNHPDLKGLWDAVEELIHEMEVNSWPTKNDLHAKIDSFKKTLNKRPLYSKLTKQESRNISVVLNATVDALKYLKQNHSKDMSGIGEILEGIYGVLDIDTYINSRITYLESIVRALDEKIWNLLEGLNSVLSSGLLNPQLAPPKNLTVAIRDAYHELPKSFKPLFDLNYNYDGEVHRYYSFAVVTAVVLFKDSVRIFVDLPMKAENRMYHLYEAHSLPVYSDLYGEFLQIVPPSELILVNKMKDKAAWMRGSTLLRECRHFDEVYICPTITALETEENNCVLNLLLMKTQFVSSLCNVVATSEDAAPTWIRDKNGWIFSVPRSTRLERVTEATRTTEIFTISGTGFLMDQRNTYTKTEDGFILYPALSNMAHEVVVPDIDITSLRDLQILKTYVAQLESGNNTRPIPVRTSNLDSGSRKESLMKEYIVHCNTTPLWVVTVINFLLLASLAAWVCIIRRPIFPGKAVYKTCSEENDTFNGTGNIDK